MLSDLTRKPDRGGDRHLVDAVFDELIETIGAFARSRAPEIVGTAPEESTGLL